MRDNRVEKGCCQLPCQTECRVEKVDCIVLLLVVCVPISCCARAL